MLVDAPCLYEDYYPIALRDPKRAAITRAIAYLREMGAWHWAKTQVDAEPRPGPGCYVVIGCRSAGEAYGGMEHALTVIGWEVSAGGQDRGAVRQ
jgi:hypothetical protein